MSKLAPLVMLWAAASAIAAEPMVHRATTVSPEDLGIIKHVLSAKPGPDEVSVLRVESPIFTPDGEIVRTMVEDVVSNNRTELTEYSVILMDRNVLFPDEADTFVVQLDGRKIERMPDCTGFKFETTGLQGRPKKSAEITITLRRKLLPEARYYFRLTVEQYSEVKKRLPELPTDNDDVLSWKYASTFYKE